VLRCISFLDLFYPMLPVLDLRAAEWHRVQGDCYLIFHIYYYKLNINLFFKIVQLILMNTKLLNNERNYSKFMNHYFKRQTKKVNFLMSCFSFLTKWNAPYISFWYNIEYVSNTFGYSIDDQIKLFFWSFLKREKALLILIWPTVFITQLMRFW
jgi:hypothetical protein